MDPSLGPPWGPMWMGGGPGPLLGLPPWGGPGLPGFPPWEGKFVHLHPGTTEGTKGNGRVPEESERKM